MKSNSLNKENFAKVFGYKEGKIVDVRVNDKIKGSEEKEPNAQVKSIDIEFDSEETVTKFKSYLKEHPAHFDYELTGVDFTQVGATLQIDVNYSVQKLKDYVSKHIQIINEAKELSKLDLLKPFGIDKRFYPFADRSLIGGKVFTSKRENHAFVPLDYYELRNFEKKWKEEPLLDNYHYRVKLGTYTDYAQIDARALKSLKALRIKETSPKTVLGLFVESKKDKYTGKDIVHKISSFLDPKDTMQVALTSREAYKGFNPETKALLEDGEYKTEKNQENKNNEIKVPAENDKITKGQEVLKKISNDDKYKVVAKEIAQSEQALLKFSEAVKKHSDAIGKGGKKAEVFINYAISQSGKGGKFIRSL